MEEIETHLFLIQISLIIQGSEGKRFCSPSCNQTPIAVAAWYNGLEPFTFEDICRYRRISLKLEEKVILSCDLSRAWGVGTEKQAKTGLLLTSAQLPFQFCCPHSLCISTTISKRPVILRHEEYIAQWKGPSLCLHRILKIHCAEWAKTEIFY